MFTATLLSPSTLEPVVLNPQLKLRPVSYSATDRGGYDLATVEVTGPKDAVQETLRWLRWGVQVVNEYGTTCWAGYIHEVECSFGAMRYRVSLEEFANKVAVLYSYEDADGVQTSGQTDFAGHAVSQARYGVRDLVIAASDTEQTAAEQLRDTELARRKFPQADGEPERGPVAATLHCRGWWYTLEWRYYTNLLGREEHTAGGETQPLGLGFTSTDVGFTVGRTVQDLGGRLRYFPEGQKIVVSGSSSNNGTKTLTSGASVEEAVSFTATSILFEPDDDIKDSTGRLEFLKKGHIVEVSGSSANSGYHVIDSEGITHVTTHAGFGGTISNESAGPSITIIQGNKCDFNESGVNEAPAATVTVTCYGQKVAQSFQISSATGWDAVKVGIQIAATGSPSDDVTVKLCSDSSGAPDTVLATGTIDADDVGDALLWRWAELGSAVTLATSTTYWITVERAGSADWDDFYSVGVDEDTGYGLGVMKVWDGSAWQNRPTNADLNFRVWGAEATTDQIEAMADGGEFIRGVLIEDASGVDTNQYRSGENTIAQEIADLLDLGDSGDDRLIAQVTNDRVLRVYADPGEALPAGIWRRDGTLATTAGNVLEPGRLLYGAWLVIEDVPPAVDALAPFSPRYVTACEFDVESKTLRPRFGERSPYDFGIRYG